MGHAVVQVAFVAALFLGANHAVAETDRQCLSGVLSDGHGIQFCHDRTIAKRWSVPYAGMSNSGLMTATFILENRRGKRVKVQLYRRSKSESLRKVARLLRTYLGLPRLRKKRSGYLLLPKRRRHKNVAEIRRFRGDKRFFIVISRRKPLHPSANSAVKDFIRSLRIHD